VSSDHGVTDATASATASDTVTDTDSDSATASSYTWMKALRYAFAAPAGSVVEAMVSAVVKEGVHSPVLEALVVSAFQGQGMRLDFSRRCYEMVNGISVSWNLMERYVIEGSVRELHALGDLKRVFCFKEIDFDERCGSRIYDSAYFGMPLISIAVLTDNFEVLKFLAEQGASLVALDEDGWSPIMHAVDSDCSPEIVEFLLSSGVDPNQEFEDDLWLDQNSLLAHAVQQKKHLSLDKVKLLIDYGASVQWRSKEGLTLAHLIPPTASIPSRNGSGSTGRQIDLFHLLIGNGVDLSVKSRDRRLAFEGHGSHVVDSVFDFIHRFWPLETILYDVYNDNMVYVRSEIEQKGAAVISVFQGGENRWTALHVAAFMNRVDILRFLLETGAADVTVKDAGGFTALHLAAARGNSECLKLFSCVK